MNIHFYKREVHKIKKELKEINERIKYRRFNKGDFRRRRFLDMLLFVYQKNISKLRQQKKLKK